MKTIDISSLYSELTSEEAATIKGAFGDVELFEDINYGGDRWRTTLGYDYVGDKWNDKVSSIIISSGTWDFYADSYQRGFHQVLGPGAYPWVENVGISNDSISSFHQVG